MHNSKYQCHMAACCTYHTLQWGAADAEIKVPSGENTERLTYEGARARNFSVRIGWFHSGLSLDFFKMF